MNAIFDTLEYVSGAEKVGIERNHAEYQAKQIAKLVDDAVLTREEFMSAITLLEQRLVIKLGIMMVACAGLMLAFLSYHH